MFLLRCVFWLSIVYASISFGGGALARHGSFEAATSDGGSMLHAVASQAVETAANFCKAHGAECLKDAAQMTTLVQATLQSDGTDESIVQDAVDVPMPIPDPRRHAASAVLTRMP